MPSVPALVSDHYGSGPGLDLGDVYGANSWLCRTFGIGCGGGGGGVGGGIQLPGMPQIPGFPGMQPTVNGQNGAMAMGGGCPVSPFRAGGTLGARAVPFVAVNPVSGRPVWFGPLGMPLLWSGDLRAVRRVRKIAGRAARFSGTRRRRRGGR